MTEIAVAIESSKNQSLGTIIRCVVALGARYLVIVGSKKIGTHGAHGSQKYVHILHFYSWKDAILHMRTIGYQEMVGLCCSGKYKEFPVRTDTSCRYLVESPLAHSFPDSTSENVEYRPETVTKDNFQVEDSRCISIDSKKFSPKSLLVLCDPKRNFTAEQQQYIDSYIYVPVVNEIFEQSIKYESKISICLLKFTNQYKEDFPEKSYCGEKFEVNMPDHRQKLFIETMYANETLDEEDMDDDYMSLFDNT